MSILIGKLIALGLDDLAVKELRILKRRLDPRDAKFKRAGNAVITPQTLDELLDFGKRVFTEEELGLVITTQLQALRLLASSRKHRQIESAISILQPSYPSSPTSLLLSAAKTTSKPDKFVRQLQLLSEILLSLGPNVSSSDDAIALEQRLSVVPEVAFQLQILALHNRSLWWQLAGHKGNLTKELLDPFLRCLSAFARRTQIGALESYRLSLDSFLKLQSIVSDLGGTEHWPKPILKGVYKILSSLAQESNCFDYAISWTTKIRGLLDSKTDSEAKRYCVEARLASLTLRRLPRQSQDEEQLRALLEALKLPFKGEPSEIDDLLTEVSSARRAAITALANCGMNRTKEDILTDGIREMCESLILQCPRFCLRYLGDPPNESSATKDIVRYEQRRQFITRPGHNAVDSVLFLVRTLSVEGNLTWDTTDSKLQDCLSLVSRLDNSVTDASPGSSPAPSYYVKISNIYYSQYLNMRRECSSSKDEQLLRALRRSIDCIRSRPQQERTVALFSTKLERMAEIYRDSGRYDELFKTLLDVQSEIIERGVLTAVSAAAAITGLHAAWMVNEETSKLARTMRSLVKLYSKCLGTYHQTALLQGNWTSDERATMLEQYLEILSSQSNCTDAATTLRTKVFQALLSIYTRQEYPLRRLRVLIRLLPLEIHSRFGIIDDLEKELNYSSTKDVMDIESSKDAGLRDYSVHLQTLATSLWELQQDQPNIYILKQGLITWSSLRRECTNLEVLEDKVEDLPGLLAHLQSIADYTDLAGSASTRLATLKLIADFNELRAVSPDHFVLSLSYLGSQWHQLGYSGKAGLALDKAHLYSQQNDVSSRTLLQLHLCYAEYLLGIGHYDKCEEHLLRAQAIYSKELESEPLLPNTLEQKINDKRLFSNAHLIHSMLALERGSAQSALAHAKQSIRLLRRAWANLEEQHRRQSPRAESPSPQTEVDKLADDTTNLNISTISAPSSADERQWPSGTEFWPLIMPLFRAMSFLSHLHAHHGMFQETLYYAEQAHKLVKEVGSEALTAMASAYLGSLWLKAGALEKSSELLMMAKHHRTSGDKTRESALLACHLGKLHSLLGDRDAEVEAYDNAEKTLQLLTEPSFINKIDCLDPADGLEQKMASLTIAVTNVSAPRKAGPSAKTPAKKKRAVRAKSPIQCSGSVAEECTQLISLKASVLRQKAGAYAFMKKSADALTILKETDGYSKNQTDIVEQSLAMAKQLLLQSTEQMLADPVYSVLQESTISFPSIIASLKCDKNSGDRLSVAKTSPPRKVPAAKFRRDLNRSRSPAPDSFFDKLRRAQEHLTEVHSMALTASPMSVIHTISALLNSIAILLSASGTIKCKPLAHPGFASCSIG
jgi:separase